MSDTDTPKKSSSMGGKLGCFMALIIPALVILPIWFFFLGPKIRHDNLMKKGIQAPGRLLDVEETGTVVNDAPELELTVEFTRKDGVLDTAFTDFVPSLRSLHFYQPGVVVTVAYDPEDPEEITIVNLTTGTPGPTTIILPQTNATVDSLKRVADSLMRMADSLRARAGGN